MSFTKQEFDTVVLGLVRGYKQAYDIAGNDYVNHLLAAECLKQAVGPGLDPKALAEFVKTVESWVTLPVVGFVPLVLRTGGTALSDRLAGTKTPSILGEVVREVKGLNAPDRGLVKVGIPHKAVVPRVRMPRAPRLPGLKTVPVTRVFDPTGALNMGIKILAELGPLLGRLQMRQANLFALDRKVVPQGRMAQVGRILEQCRQPEQLEAAVQTSLDQYDATWDHLLRSVAEMETHRRALGLPPVTL